MITVALTQGQSKKVQCLRMIYRSIDNPYSASARFTIPNHPTAIFGIRVSDQEGFELRFHSLSYIIPRLNIHWKSNEYSLLFIDSISQIEYSSKKNKSCRSQATIALHVSREIQVKVLSINCKLFQFDVGNRKDHLKQQEFMPQNKTF